MNKNYKEEFNSVELSSDIQDMLLKRGDDKNVFSSIETAIESADQYVSDDEINCLKEEEVINKLREKTGFTGIGLAGTQLALLLLTGFNIF